MTFRCWATKRVDSTFRWPLLPALRTLPSPTPELPQMKMTTTAGARSGSSESRALAQQQQPDTPSALGARPPTRLLADPLPHATRLSTTNHPDGLPCFRRAFRPFTFPSPCCLQGLLGFVRAGTPNSPTFSPTCYHSLHPTGLTGSLVRRAFGPLISPTHHRLDGFRAG